jgi:hypothetical protein
MSTLPREAVFVGETAVTAPELRALYRRSFSSIRDKIDLGIRDAHFDSLQGWLNCSATTSFVAIGTPMRSMPLRNWGSEGGLTNGQKHSV